MKTIPSKERILEDLQILREHGLETAFDLQATEFALQFTAKMMGKPSEDMVLKGVDAWYEHAGWGFIENDNEAVFKAIRDQAIKEVLDET